MTELTARQRFELAMRCIEIEDAAVIGDGLVESFADLVRFAHSEHIVPSMFDRCDRDPLRHAFTAAVMVAHPEDLSPHSLGGRALIAAGLGELVPDDSDDEEYDRDEP